MAERMERPIEKTITWTRDVTLQDIVHAATASKQSMEETKHLQDMKNHDRVVTNENAKHQLNLALTQAIHTLLAHYANPQSIAKQLSQKKRSFLASTNPENLDSIPSLVQTFLTSASDVVHCETESAT